MGSFNLFSEARQVGWKKNNVICLRVLKRKAKTCIIRIAFETPVTIKHSRARGPIILKKDFSLSQFCTVKFVRIIFVNMFRQIISITPCELAFPKLMDSTCIHVC